MKNLFKESEFMLGVTKFNNLPADEGVEILLAGRSNAGKSSALNALTDNPKLARISKTPGRTTEINYFKVNKTLKLVDLPGYGFAKSSFHKRKDWAPLLEEYFAKSLDYFNSCTMNVQILCNVMRACTGTKYQYIFTFVISAITVIC